MSYLLLMPYLSCPDICVLFSTCPAIPVLITLFYCSLAFIYVLMPFASRVLISLHYCPNTFVLLPRSYFSVELVATYPPILYLLLLLLNKHDLYLIRSVKLHFLTDFWLILFILDLNYSENYIYPNINSKIYSR